MQPSGLLPLLGGCTTAYFVSCLMMHNTIMTEKIARRGTRVPSEYGADFLDQVHVADVGIKPVVCLYGGQSFAEVRSWIAGDSNAAHHQGYPLLSADQRLLGVVTRRDLLDPNGPAGEVHLGDLPRRNAAVVYDDNSLREAADHMVNERVGRLPVVTRAEPDKVVGIITRGDLLSAHSRRLDEKNVKTRSIDLRGKTTPPLE
jgi:CBS domain-containing protein